MEEEKERWKKLRDEVGGDEGGGVGGGEKFGVWRRIAFDICSFSPTKF